jgi:hypothetical protein
LAAGESARSLDVLAAAYAESGRFPEAAATAKRALALVPPADTAFAQAVRDRIRLYEAGVAFREPGRTPTPGSVPSKQGPSSAKIDLVPHFQFL